jgi:hypothetical protein
METVEVLHQIHNAISTILAFAFYIAIPVFIIYKGIKKRKLPNNSYTPVDDILDGKVRDDEEKDNQIQHK